MKYRIFYKKETSRPAIILTDRVYDLSEELHLDNIQNLLNNKTPLYTKAELFYKIESEWVYSNDLVTSSLIETTDYFTVSKYNSCKIVKKEYNQELDCIDVYVDYACEKHTDNTKFNEIQSLIKLINHIFENDNNKKKTVSYDDITIF